MSCPCSLRQSKSQRVARNGPSCSLHVLARDIWGHGEFQWICWGDGGTHMLPMISRKIPEESTFGNNLLWEQLINAASSGLCLTTLPRSQLITCRQPSAAKEIHWRETHAKNTLEFIQNTKILHRTGLASQMVIKQELILSPKQLNKGFCMSSVDSVRDRAFEVCHQL